MFLNYRYLFLSFFLLLGLQLIAKDVPEKPNPPRLVNDFAGLLSAQERNALERKLVAYDDSTSTQIAIVIERSLEGDDPFDYSFRLAEKWQIGRKGKDNGILFYIAVEDREIYIQNGYGVEGFFTDNIARRVIENVVKPAFRQNQYYQGLNRATDIVIAAGNGEYTNDGRRNNGSTGIGVPVILLFLLIFLVVIIIANRNSDDDDDGGYYRGGRYDMDPYPRRRRRRGGGGWIIMPGGFGGGGGGGWLDGGGGGFGGGGFGGFGGGGFGGGGAGGSW